RRLRFSRSASFSRSRRTSRVPFADCCWPLASSSLIAVPFEFALGGALPRGCCEKDHALNNLKRASNSTLEETEDDDQTGGRSARRRALPRPKGRGTLTPPFCQVRQVPRLRACGPCGKDQPALWAFVARFPYPGHAAVAQW